MLTEKKADGSPVQEIVEDGDAKAEIHNKESFGGLFTERMRMGLQSKKLLQNSVISFASNLA
jgi:hypothetical protein